MILQMFHSLNISCEVFLNLSYSFISACFIGDHTTQQYSILCFIYALNIFIIISVSCSLSSQYHLSQVYIVSAKA